MGDEKIDTNVDTYSNVGFGEFRPPFWDRSLDLEPPTILPPPPAPKDLRGQGLKYDAGKPRMSLLPFDALLWVAEVLTFGAKKYEANGWRTVPNALERYQDAMLRHFEALQRGEWADLESGLPHWAHLCCDALFCLWFACQERTQHGLPIAQKTVSESLHSSK